MRARLLSPLWVTLLPLFLALLPHVLPDSLLDAATLVVVVLLQIPAALWLLVHLRGRGVAMRVDEGGLHAGGQLLEMKENIRGVWIAAEQPLLFVDGKRFRTFRFETTHEAAVVRDAISARRPRRTFRFRRSQWNRGLWMGGNRVLYCMFFGIVVVVSLWRFISMTCVALLRPAPDRVELGPDGIAIVSGRTTHAAPWSKVEGVACEKGVARVELVDAAPIAFNVPDESVLALLAAVRDAQRAHAAAGVARELARPSGSLASWAREMRGEHDALYREGALSPEVLLEIAASPTALPDAPASA